MRDEHRSFTRLDRDVKDLREDNIKVGSAVPVSRHIRRYHTVALQRQVEGGSDHLRHGPAVLVDGGEVRQESGANWLQAVGRDRDVGLARRAGFGTSQLLVVEEQRERRRCFLWQRDGWDHGDLKRRHWARLEKKLFCSNLYPSVCNLRLIHLPSLFLAHFVVLLKTNERPLDFFVHGASSDPGVFEAFLC